MHFFFRLRIYICKENDNLYEEFFLLFQEHLNITIEFKNCHFSGAPFFVIFLHIIFDYL